MIMAFQSVMEWDTVNLNSQSYMKVKLSDYRHDHRGARRGVLTSTAWSETRQQQIIDHQSSSTYLLEDVSGKTDTKRTKCASLVSEHRGELRTTPNPRKPSLQRSKPSVTTSPPLSSTTRCAWRMNSQSEWKLRPFWRVSQGRLLHSSLKLRLSELKRKV